MGPDVLGVIKDQELIASLSSIGLILGVTGYQLGIITVFAYQLTISVITLSLICKPFSDKLINNILMWKRIIASHNVP